MQSIILNCNHILQYYRFYCICSLDDFFQKKKKCFKSYQPQTSEW